MLHATLLSLKNEFKELADFLSESSYGDVTLESDSFQKIMDHRFRRIKNLIAKSDEIIDGKKITKLKLCKSYIIGFSESKKSSAKAILATT